MLRAGDIVKVKPIEEALFGYNINSRNTGKIGVVTHINIDGFGNLNIEFPESADIRGHSGHVNIRTPGRNNRNNWCFKEDELIKVELE